MTQEKKNGKIIAIITMIFLFGMISFVTNLAAPMGIVLKNQFDVSNALGMLGNFGNFIAYAVRTGVQSYQVKKRQRAYRQWHPLAH